MRDRLGMLAFVLFVVASSQAVGGEPAGGGPTQPHPFQRAHPVGGWSPYGGGIFHWWNPNCFPCETAPDDYCRKPLPRLCWPPYPDSYVWGPPEIGYRNPRAAQSSQTPH